MQTHSPLHLLRFVLDQPLGLIEEECRVARKSEHYTKGIEYDVYVQTSKQEQAQVSQIKSPRYIPIHGNST